MKKSQEVCNLRESCNWISQLAHNWQVARMALGFVTKKLLDLHCLDELKNFAVNIFLKLVIRSRIRIRVIG